jgi:hypothetical protein
MVLKLILGVLFLILVFGVVYFFVKYFSTLK